MTVFEGNTVAAAIAAGLKQLHRTRNQVTVEVIAEAKKGFLGLGKQPAQVKITAVPASTAAETTTAAKQPQTAETTDQSAALQRPATSSAPASAETSPAKSIVAPDVSTGPVVPGDAGLADETVAPADATRHSANAQPTEVQDVETKVSAAGKPQAGVETETTTKVAATKAVNTQDADHQTNGKAAKSAAPKAKPAKAKAAHDAATTPTPRTPAEIAARQAANETAIRDLSAYLLEVVKQLGIAADLDVDFGNRYATLNFNTAKQGLLIGKHGRTINALQDLAQVYMNHHGASHVNVVLDVDDYRDRRVATLKRLAESTAREVIATGKQVFLDPMPSFERKLIHAELANNYHVTTFSEGREPYRAVVVAIRK